MGWKDVIKDWTYNLGFVISDSKAVITKFVNENDALSIGPSGGLINFYKGMEIVKSGGTKLMDSIQQMILIPMVLLKKEL